MDRSNYQNTAENWKAVRAAVMPKKMYIYHIFTYKYRERERDGKG